MVSEREALFLSELETMLDREGLIAGAKGRGKRCGLLLLFSHLLEDHQPHGLEFF